MNASPDSRVRLDELLVSRGIFASRSRARDAVLRGRVLVDGVPATKPGRPTAPESALSVDDPARGYVSRAALKLIAGLDRFGFDAAGATALDLGASTGGFTQVLLERGAAHVFAVDVGHGQMRRELAQDPRVTVLEGVNARDLGTGMPGGVSPDLVVCDVSFISLRLALPPALSLAAPGARAMLLVKPQFEVGREKIGKGGIVRDPEVGRLAAEAIRDWLGTQHGWCVLGLKPSPIEGGDGNHEYLLGAVKNP